MSEIKSLADQLRSRMAQTDTEISGKSPPKKKAIKTGEPPEIVALLRAYDLAGHKSMIHIRFDGPTSRMLQHLKMATGIEVNKVVGYAVRQLIEQHPELKTIVKEFIQKLEL